jgi:hypothetical protein
MVNKPTLEELVNYLIAFSTSHQERASKDIMLMAHVITEAGEHVVIGFPQGMNPGLRSSFGATVRRVVRDAVGDEDHIALLAVVHTAWMSVRRDVAPSEDPAREEILVVYGINRRHERLLRAYALLRFGDEIRLRPLDNIRVLPPDESGYSPTFDQVFDNEGEP